VVKERAKDSYHLKTYKSIVTLFGTRPEVIKLAPVIQELEEHGDLFRTINVTSGQHNGLLYPFIRQFGLRIDYDLKVMQSAHEIPALWFWSRFNREKGTRKEVKGYVRGGYHFLTERLISSLRERGARLHLKAPVECLDLDKDDNPRLKVGGCSEKFDRVVITTPLGLLQQIARNGRMKPWLQALDSGIDYQGVVSVVLLMRRGLTKYYWVAAIDEGIPFQGIVESSALLERQNTGGFHLAYLVNYVHRTHPLFRREDRDIIEEYLTALEKAFFGFQRSDVVDSFVFRAPFVETLYTKGYLKRKPPAELVPDRVYLATSAQVYPGVTSWNASSGLAKEVVRLMARQPVAA
jgi:protoporphyrinogen oxidase